MPLFGLILSSQIHPDENYTLENKRKQVYYSENKTENLTTQSINCIILL
jgi:hypothetical protein